MGTWYKVVNPEKRQYLNIESFGESFKWGSLITGGNGQSLHAIAIAWLTCRFESRNRDASDEDVDGSWFGDPIYLASDEAPPDLNGLTTSTPEDPERNLYRMAHDFEDITPRVIVAICEKDPDIAGILVGRILLAGDGKTPSPCSLLYVLGRTVLQLGSREIEEALECRFGEQWKEEYTKAEQYRSQLDSNA